MMVTAKMPVSGTREGRPSGVIAGSPPSRRFLGFSRRIPREELLVTVQQISVAVAAGVHLKTVIDRMAADCANDRLKAMLWDISATLSSGKSLSLAIARHPDSFSQVEVQLVKTGEAAGKLAEVLRRIAEDMENRDILAGKVRSALAYPSFVLMVAFVLSAGLLAWGVPQVQGVYESMGAKLPLPTQIMVALGNLLGSAWPILLVGGLALVLFLPRLLKDPAVRRVIEHFLLHIPPLSELHTMLNASYFARTMALTYRSGLPVVQALELIQKGSGSERFQGVIGLVRKRIEGGEPISTAMRATKYFPSLAVEMVATGEQTGHLDAMLDELTRFYTRRCTQAIERLTGLLEPALTVLVGILLGGIILGLGLPFLNMPSVLM